MAGGFPSSLVPTYDKKNPNAAVFVGGNQGRASVGVVVVVLVGGGGAATNVGEVTQIWMRGGQDARRSFVSAFLVFYEKFRWLNLFVHI